MGGSGGGVPAGDDDPALRAEKESRHLDIEVYETEVPADAAVLFDLVPELNPVVAKRRGKSH